MNYDFVEVGTCNVGTIIQDCGDTAVGLSIEPLLMYLNDLPNKPNVKKINAALVAPQDMSEDGMVDMYYVHPNTVSKHNLGGWLTGCNTTVKPHDFHINYFSDPVIWHTSKDRSSLPTRNLLEEGLVTHERVKCLTFAKLVEIYNVEKIEMLKTDTEGYDCILIESILDFYETNKGILPTKIWYESNAHTPTKQLDKLWNRLEGLGYKLQHLGEFAHDTLAVKE